MRRNHITACLPKGLCHLRGKLCAFKRRMALAALLLAIGTTRMAGQERLDTTKVYNLGEVVVEETARQKALRSTMPVQTLDAERLLRTGAVQLSDAAKMFSGVTVKDYGGIGGLKTISIRSLGAAHTAVAYDGIPVTDAQTGQTDLGKLSIGNVERVSLTGGQGDDIFQAARLFASAGVLHVQTRAPSFQGKDVNFAASMKAGSFGFANPNLCIENRWTDRIATSVTADYTHIHGAYPYLLHNGTATERRHRRNSDVQSGRAEANLHARIGDGQEASAKLYYYQSQRGLPTNILYNDYAGQRLWDRNFFAQGRYENRISSRWSILAQAKYNRAYNRYYDPSALNMAREENNHYRQDEYYLSATALCRPTAHWSVSLATDAFADHLEADLDGFAIPTRYTLLNALAAKYVRPRFTATASLLSTLTRETVRHGQAAPGRQRLSPAASLSVQPFAGQDLRIRLFYKDIFRLPTFNDLYYGQAGTRTLRPEKAWQLDGGFTWDIPAGNLPLGLTLSADAFYNRVTDKIVAMPGKNLFVWSMMNIGRVDIKGVETSLQARIGIGARIALRVAGNYTWQRALDKTDRHTLPYRATFNHQIPYTPRHSGAASATLETPWASVGYTLVASGLRYCNQYNSSEYLMEGYAEHSLSLWREFRVRTCRLHVQAEAINVGNRQYEIVKNYPMPGRQFRASLTLKY